MCTSFSPVAAHLHLFTCSVRLRALLQASRDARAVLSKSQLQARLECAAVMDSPVVGAGSRDGHATLTRPTRASCQEQHQAHPPDLSSSRRQQESAGRQTFQHIQKGKTTAGAWRPVTAAPTAPERELWAEDVQHPARFCAACRGALSLAKLLTCSAAT